MPRKVFYSFHFANDAWRAGQVRNSGVVEGDEPVSDNDWETIKKKGDANIENWINGQFAGKPCVVVLIGSQTSTRRWVDYEIRRGWNEGKGVLGIHIHRLLDSHGQQSAKGANPIAAISMKNGGFLSTYAAVYDTPFVVSTDVYA